MPNSIFEYLIDGGRGSENGRLEAGSVEIGVLQAFDGAGCHGRGHDAAGRTALNDRLRRQHQTQEMEGLSRRGEKTWEDVTCSEHVGRNLEQQQQ